MHYIELDLSDDAGQRIVRELRERVGSVYFEDGRGWSHEIMVSRLDRSLGPDREATWHQDVHTACRP
jgi:hypothetical protein